MLASVIPAKFNVPWASSAGAGYITTPIPVTTVAAGRASLAQGFPTTTFEPEASGGNPPWGADMNGILNEVTAWLQWNQAGGSIVGYDATFSTAITGYPNRALLQSATVGHYWQSTIDNNTSNPDTGGANWTLFPDVLIQQQSGNWTPTDTGTTNAPAITLYPQPASWASLIGAPLRFLIGFTNTTTSVTLAIAGLAGTKTLKNPDGTGMVIAQLTAGGLVEGFYDGTVVQVAAPGKPATASPPPGGGGLQPGMIILCPVEIPFVGTLECNGASLLRASYPNLFNCIGTRYGAADGNHFNLPDMRGMFPRGWDHGRGMDPSAGSRTAPTAPGATCPAGDHVGTSELSSVGSFNISSIFIEWPILYRGAGHTWGSFLYGPQSTSVGPATGIPYGGLPPSIDPFHSPPYVFGSGDGGYPAWPYQGYWNAVTTPVLTQTGLGSVDDFFNNSQVNSYVVQTLGGLGGNIVAGPETRPINIDMMYVIVY